MSLPLQIVQVSDPHFGTERAHVVSALRALVRSEKPSVVILSGDITQRARPKEFRAAREFVDSLGVSSVLAIPGNHDISLFNPIERLCFPYARFAQAFGKQLEQTYETSALLVLGVNTTRRYRHTDGEVSRAQIERVAARLSAASPLQLRVVVTHQPVHVLQERDVRNLLRGHERAVAAWSAAGADLIVGGHIHLPYVCPLVGEAASTLPRRIWSVQAGTALSTRVRQGIPNSVNLIRYTAEQPRYCLVERWDYETEHAAFERVNATELELDRP